MCKVDFLDYRGDTKATTDINQFVSVTNLARTFFSANDNISFQKAKIKEALELLWEEQRQTWPQPLKVIHRRFTVRHGCET